MRSDCRSARRPSVVELTRKVRVDCGAWGIIPPGLLMPAKLMSPSVSSESAPTDALYQGTTLVGPNKAAHYEGFSPCGPLSIPAGLCAAFPSSTSQGDIIFAAFNSPGGCF